MISSLTQIRHSCLHNICSKANKPNRSKVPLAQRILRTTLRVSSETNFRTNSKSSRTRWAIIRQSRHLSAASKRYLKTSCSCQRRRNAVSTSHHLSSKSATRTSKQVSRTIQGTSKATTIIKPSSSTMDPSMARITMVCQAAVKSTQMASKATLRPRLCASPTTTSSITIVSNSSSSSGTRGTRAREQSVVTATPKSRIMHLVSSQEVVC